MKTIIATIAILAAAVGFGDTERQANQSWVLHKIDEVVGTNTAAQIAALTNGTRSVDGAARPLPAYLHALTFDDTYPEDAAWWYARADYSNGGGGCSARRTGGVLERNYDFPFDDVAEFVVGVSATTNRFASLGVANVGQDLTEAFVTSGKPSRFYKCLPGHTLDGINENGLAVEVNITTTSGVWRTTGEVHCLGAVRWALDHGVTAGATASNLAAKVYVPAGFGSNFHYMVADAAETWIVENGEARKVDGVAVMTNFSADRIGGEGYERWTNLVNGASITSQWWTAAYDRNTRPIRVSDIGANYAQVWDAWDAQPREAHRGQRIGGIPWWQTLHTSVYDLATRTLRICVQERGDWYTFALPSVGGGKVKSVNGKDGEVVLNAADVGAVGTNEYWSVKKGGEGGIGVKLGVAGTYSTFYVGYNDFGEIQNGAHWQYTNGGYEDFFSGSVLRMLTGSQLWWLTGAKPWLQTDTDFHIGGNSYGGGKTLPKYVDDRIEEMTDNAAVLANGALKTKGGTAITPQHIGAATPGQVQAVDDKADSALAQSATTREVVTTLVGQVNGSNIVIVVTNYLSGAYILDAAKLQIRELRDGQYRTVYNSRDEILLHLGAFETNKLNAAKAELRAEIAAVLAEMQHDAWGRRTSTGNPAPSNTIYTTEPSFVFGGGLEYERIAVGAGAIGILMDKGAPSYTAGDSGTFLFKDATGENYFGYSMTSGYAIGVPTDGIQVTGQRVTLTYNIVGSCPIVMWCPALFPGCAKDITGAGWYQLNDEEGNPIEGAPFECAVDMESTPEVATVYIDTGENPTGFFSAWTSVPGTSSFKTNMPMDLDAANGGGVVSSDGHTVIVPQPDGTWRPSNAN